ncbi:MAG TPA: serine/threonine-protein kinase [Pseudonocardiaceae bacterium]|nr:serine/threonine-protein kinase [Pseudonocardiaceae bacterium]
MTVSTGQLLAQRYRLGRRIAVGGMGEVWEAEDTRLGRQVAVKVLKPELSGDPEFRARFQTEARLTASLNHPGIAAVHDYGETDVVRSGRHGTQTEQQTAYLVMELVAGDPLSAILQRHPRLSPERTLDILGQAAQAVAAAHERGLVHRDIKPANILITPAGRVKLTDFGIAKAVDTAPVTREGMVMGTAHYIAPEQAAGQEAGPASDVYSLGVVGYECLAGQRPFVTDSAVAVAMMHIRDTPPPLPPDVPPGVRALIEAALVKDPAQRYRTGDEFAAAVAAVRAGRKPPLPLGLAGSAATAALTGHYPAQTALLPPGALSGPRNYGPPTGPPSGPHTGPRREPYPGDHPAQRRSGQRTAIGVAVALLVVLGLVLGGYLIREMVRTSGTTPESGSGVPAAPPPATSAAPPPAAPAPPPEPTRTEEPEPTTEQPTPEPTQTEDTPEQIVVNPSHYLGKSGSSAADRAREDGLEPRVIDEKGDEIDPDDQSKCRVTSIDPFFGSVAPGSSLELTCQEWP